MNLDAVLYGIQHSSDYKLQYTIATIPINTRIIRNSQSVISDSQTINPITPIIIAVIPIAVINFIIFITIYRLRNKPFNLPIYIHPFQASFTYFLILGTSCSFLIHQSMTHNYACLVVELLLIAFLNL